MLHLIFASLMAATTRVDAGYSQSDWPSSRLASRNAYWKLRTRLRNKRAWFWSYGHGLAQQFGNFIRALIRRANTVTDTKSDWFEIRGQAQLLVACGVFFDTLRNLAQHQFPLRHHSPIVVRLSRTAVSRVFGSWFLCRAFLRIISPCYTSYVRKGRVRDPCEPIA